MATSDRFPTVPTERLRADGWTCVDERVETVFQNPGMRVEGATRLFDDDATRRAVTEGGGPDLGWRFFFATTLTFSPPLPPGMGRAMLLPTIRSASQTAFERELRERGCEQIHKGSAERTRVESGARARLRKYSAALPLEGRDKSLSVTGWVAVWHDDGYRIGAGGYPDQPLAETLAIDDPPERLERTARDYREELLELIKAVA